MMRRAVTENDCVALAGRLEEAIRILDSSRVELAAVLPVMRQGGHPRLNRYLAFAHRAGFTLDELGQMIGCTRERIRQRIAAGDPTPRPDPFVIDETVAERLRDLRARADGRAPSKREITLAYRAELDRLKRCGATYGQIAKAAGVTAADVAAQVRHHRRTHTGDAA